MPAGGAVTRFVIPDSGCIMPKMAGLGLFKGACSEEAIAGLRRQRPVRLTPLLIELDIRARLSSLSPTCSGSIEHAQERWTIRINRREAAERQRYTVALEISHVVLNRDLLLEHGHVAHDVLYRSKLPDRVESEARKLALDILLPAPAVRDDWLAAGASTEEQQLIDLAAAWRVTPDRMEVRIAGLVDCDESRLKINQ